MAVILLYHPNQYQLSYPKRMAKDVRWQFSIAQRQVPAGATVPIIEKWSDSSGYHLRLGVHQQSAEFLVTDVVRVGGKDYLLLEENAGSGELIIVRTQGQQAVSAIDQDRLSSLRNALEYFFEQEREQNKKAEILEAIYGERWKREPDTQI